MDEGAIEVVRDDGSRRAYYCIPTQQAVLRQLGGEMGVWGSGDYWKLQSAG